jgi:cell division protease FtsH
MLDEMCSLFGGRAAEELFTGHISTGAMNDLERATKSAFGMIAYAGMSDKLPNICYYNNQEYQFQRPYSETTAKLIDDEVLKMINEQYARAKEILLEHKEGHNQLAELLITREVIFAEDVEAIFGKRPWVSRSQEIMEANAEAEKKEEPKLEDMPEAVKQAQAEFEQSEKSELSDQSELSDKSDKSDKSAPSEQ